MIRVFKRNGSGGAVTPRSPAHKEEAYGQGQCTPGAVAVRKLLPASSLRRRDRRWAADRDGALSGADQGWGSGYAIREYSLFKGDEFYRFPKSGGHLCRAIIRQEWYRETKTRLPDSVFEAADNAFLRSFMIPLIGLCSAPSVGC